MIQPRTSIVSPLSNVASGNRSQEEEKSSLLSESDPIAQNVSDNKPLQFDNLGEEYEKLQKLPIGDFEEVKEDERT